MRLPISTKPARSNPEDSATTGFFFFFSSRRRHTRFDCDWSSDVCSSDLGGPRRRAHARAAWLHAVSVGEAIAAAPLVDGLRRLCPDLPLVVTTVTETGARVVRERYARLATHRFFPLDLPWATRRFVAELDPAFLVCMETELWPNLLRTRSEEHTSELQSQSNLVC